MTGLGIFPLWEAAEMASLLPAALADLIAPYCSDQLSPGQDQFQAVDREGIRILAEALRTTSQGAMIFCLEHDIWPLRFARNRGVFNAAEQRAILTSHAAIIGCGGLGGHVATLLARAGVGAFTLCDFDFFEESNCNRQLLCRENTLGRNKAEVTKEELVLIAPYADIRVFPIQAVPAVLPEILDSAHIVMDCLDSIETRKQVAAAAAAAKIPFIHGAVAGEEGFALAVLPGEKNLDLLYAETPSSNDGAEKRLGISTLAPAAIAVLQVNIALQLMAGRKLENNGLLHLDLSGPMLEQFQLAR